MAGVVEPGGEGGRAGLGDMAGTAAAQGAAKGGEAKPLTGIAFLRAYPAFSRLWLGQLVSRFGDALDAVAFIWLVLELTGSTLLVGTLMVVNMLPSILLNPFTGVWVDRVRRRPLIIVSDAARAFTTGLVAVLYITGHLDVWHLYVVTALNSVFEALAVPARMAVIPQVVPPQDLVSANSLNSLSSSFASLFGLLMAAPVFQFLGIAGAVGVDAATFLFAALTAAGATIPELPRASDPHAGPQDAPARPPSAAGPDRPEGNKAIPLAGAVVSFFHELREGLKLVATQRVILYLIILAGLVNFAVGPIEVLMPVHVRKVLGMDVEQLSQVYLAFSAGTLASGFLTMRVARGWPEAVLVLVGLGMMGTGYAGLYFGRNFTVTLGLMLVMGLGQAPAQAGLQTAVQRRTPPEVMGRVAGLLNTFALAALPLSLAVTGAVAEVVATPVVFGALGLLVLVATGLILTRPVFGLAQIGRRGITRWKKSNG